MEVDKNIKFINKIRYSDYYNLLYPTINKPMFVEYINLGSWKTDDSLSAICVQKLVKVLKSEINSTDIDVNALDRAEKSCTRKKRITVKNKDKDGNKFKTKHRVTVTKNGFKDIRDKYINEQDTLEEYSDEVLDLYERVESGQVTDDDLPLIDYILHKNRWNVVFCSAGLILLLAVFSFLIILHAIHS